MFKILLSCLTGPCNFVLPVIKYVVVYVFLQRNVGYISFIKTGIHIHWPEIFLNTEQALLFRNIIIQYFMNYYETEVIGDDWENRFYYLAIQRHVSWIVPSFRVTNDQIMIIRA